MAAALEDVDRRTTSLENAQGENAESLRWTVAKLGRIQAVQDEHTLRLERLDTVQQDHTLRLARLEQKLDGLIEALPGIVDEAVRSSR